jgi:hypothetical protein
MVPPSTLKECFEALDILLSSKAKQEILDSPDEKIMVEFHHGLGRYIRNNWGLWQKNSNLYRLFVGMGVEHPDDMSGIILDSYYRVKHNLPLNLKDQVKLYQDYWAKKNETN